MPQAARFSLKVYDPTGTTFRRVFDAGLQLSNVQITRQVNSPASDVSVDIALPWDNFGYGQSTGINPADQVDIYALPGATLTNPNPVPVLVYQGHVEEITGTYADDGTNHVTLRLFPIDALLGRSLWKAASYVVSYPAGTVNGVISDIIDNINSIYGATVLTKNLGTPGVTINQTFTRQTHQSALQIAAAFADSTWFWRIRANGQFDLQQYSDSTQVHTLVMNSHISSIKAIKSLLNTKNKALISWGGTPTDSEYSDATSISNYLQRQEIITDSSIGDLATANLKGNAEIAKLKNVFTKTQITVNATYDIHTIQPGDTVKIVNISNLTTQMVTGVLRVMRVQYDGALAILDLADIMDNFGVEFAKAR